MGKDEIEWLSVVLTLMADGGWAKGLPHGSHLRLPPRQPRFIKHLVKTTIAWIANITCNLVSVAKCQTLYIKKSRNNSSKCLTLVWCSYFCYSASVRGGGGPAAFWGF